MTGTPVAMAWGSDAVAELLRRLGVPWVALNPGASYRGLHDSLVNDLGNRDPRILLALHEEQDCGHQAERARVLDPARTSAARVRLG